jgi:hypothetical protein
MNSLTASTNWKYNITAVPTTSNKSYTITFIINTASYDAYGNTCQINGTNVTMIASGGLANIALTTSDVIIQTITIVYTTGLFKVFTSITEYY